MEKAVEFAKQHDDKLVRYPGGFWMQAGLTAADDAWMNRKWFGTSTVEALVKKGAMVYTQWQGGRHGQFPVEAALAYPGGDDPPQT
jgi:hypothetical protein